MAINYINFMHFDVFQDGVDFAVHIQINEIGKLNAFDMLDFFEQFRKIIVVDEIADNYKVVGRGRETNPSAFGIHNLHKIESVAVFASVVEVKREFQTIFIDNVGILYKIDIQ